MIKMINKELFLKFVVAASNYVASNNDVRNIPVEIRELSNTNPEQYNVFINIVMGITRTCRNNDIFGV